MPQGVYECTRCSRHTVMDSTGSYPGGSPGFVMLNEVKHLASNRSGRALPYLAQILRWRSG
jgi:hypothetical protein